MVNPRCNSNSNYIFKMLPVVPSFRNIYTYRYVSLCCSLRYSYVDYMIVIIKESNNSVNNNIVAGFNGHQSESGYADCGRVSGLCCEGRRV